MKPTFNISPYSP